MFTFHPWKYFTLTTEGVWSSPEQLLCPWLELPSLVLLWADPSDPHQTHPFSRLWRAECAETGSFKYIYRRVTSSVGFSRNLKSQIVHTQVLCAHSNFVAMKISETFRKHIDPIASFLWTYGGAVMNEGNQVTCSQLLCSLDYNSTRVNEPPLPSYREVGVCMFSVYPRERC